MEVFAARRIPTTVDCSRFWTKPSVLAANRNWKSFSGAVQFFRRGFPVNSDSLRIMQSKKFLRWLLQNGSSYAVHMFSPKAEFLTQNTLFDRVRRRLGTTAISKLRLIACKHIMKTTKAV